MRWLGLAAALFVLPAAAQADVLVTISKARQQMDVSIDGVPSYRWAVSTGRAGFDTPSGAFRAIRLEEVYYSKKFDDAPMPNSVFFYGGYAIHGTMEERRLGTPASHGCVRLARPNAATLFGLVRQHGMARTRVVIVDGAAPVQSAPVARLAPREDYRDDRDFRAFGGRGRIVMQTVIERPPAMRYRDSIRYSRRDWRDAPPARAAWRRSPPVYDVRHARPVYETRYVSRPVIEVRRYRREAGFDW